MTGEEINRIYEQQIGQPYSGIEDPAKKNRRFRKALINSIENKYRNLDEAREFMELRDVIKTEVSFVPDANNKIDIFSNNISHVLAIRADYKTTLEDIVIKDISLGANSIPVMTLYSMSNLRTGSIIEILNPLGTLPPGNSAVLYLKQISAYKYQLYINEQLTVPFIIAGPYVSSPAPTVKVIHRNYCYQIRSDEKISELKKGSVEYPAYEIESSAISIFPRLPDPCFNAAVDYIKSDVVFFDLQDAIIEYLQFYSEKFIYYVISNAAKSFDLDYNDYGSASAQEREILINP
jgi:hypothetical protein